MAQQPRLLDLFCGAGGAGAGYARAGFDVVGVDLAPQPDYPFTFIQADAMTFPLDGFDAIHASPPCQAFTSLKVMHNAREHADLLTPTRERLLAWGGPFVIENVVGAPLQDPVLLCGTMFGLGVTAYDGWRELRRHRLFETCWPLLGRRCQHKSLGAVGTIGLYGDHARDRRRKANGQASIDFPMQDGLRLGKEAMGMPWASRWRSLTQAIPPAFTEHIGAQLLAHLSSSVAPATSLEGDA